MQVSGRSQNLAIIMLAEAYGRHRCQTLSLKKPEKAEWSIQQRDHVLCSSFVTSQKDAISKTKCIMAM